MTFHTRLLTTPAYVNDGPSAFWSHMAREVSFLKGERCKHSNNYLNMRVYCLNRSEKLHVVVICEVCHKIFDDTAEQLQNKYFGMYGF